LRRVTLNAESDAELSTARIAEEVLTSTTAREENLAERLALLQKFVAEQRGASGENLEKRLVEYDKRLDEHGIESEFLALAQYSKWFILRQALRRLWKLLIFSPLAALGAILHFPAYQICKFLAFLQTRKGDFDMASTVKVLASIVLMPLTWVVFAGVLSFYFGWQTALISIPFSFLCGYVALRTLEEIAELRGWAKAILLFIGKRDKFLRLLAERGRLFEKVNLSKK
jgi:hypothetical protein